MTDIDPNNAMLAATREAQGQPIDAEPRVGELDAIAAAAEAFGRSNPDLGDYVRLQLAIRAYLAALSSRPAGEPVAWRGKFKTEKNWRYFKDQQGGWDPDKYEQEPLYTAPPEPLESQVDRLANFIMAEVPGEPSQSEGAIDTAIRWMRSALTAPPQAEQADLVEAAKRLLAVIDMAGLLNLSNGVQLGQTSWFVKASDACAWLRAALQKQER